LSIILTIITLPSYDKGQVNVELILSCENACEKIIVDDKSSDNNLGTDELFDCGGFEFSQIAPHPVIHFVQRSLT
jgi:hypothetical protein